MSFDVSGNAYDRFMGRYARELASAFADFVGVHKGKVVDVGCGSGILTEELTRRVGADNVAAADPSPLLETCRERVPEADVRPGTAEELPWPDDSFDAALAQLVLHFLDDPVVGIKEMRRVTRPGGVVAASTWNFPQMPLVRTFWESARDLRLDAPSETQQFETLDALAAGADQADLDAEPLLDQLDVAARSRRQLGDVGQRVEGLLPAWQRLVDGLAVVEVALVGGEVLGLGAVAESVPDADGQLGERREHVELRQRERRHAVQAHRVAQRDEIEPAAAPRSE